MLKTVETAKLIRQELATLYPEIKFSVRKEDTAVIRVYHSVTDLTWRTHLDQFLQRFVGWDKFSTEYIFEAVQVNA